jgi:hypothetical protein
MRVIVESDGSERRAAVRSDADGTYDGGPSHESSADASGMAPAIDAGPPPPALLDALGYQPAPVDLGTDIDAGPGPV